MNRDDPAMHCDGKCFLKKQLGQNQQRKNKEDGAIGSRMDILLFSPDNNLVFSAVLCSIAFIFPTLKPVYLPTVYSEFFRPPRV